ncbi:MAG: glycosyltransferase family 2 protein [Sphingomonadaceae bacterium]
MAERDPAELLRALETAPDDALRPVRPLLSDRVGRDPARLGVILVNYRQAAVTIECLESLLRLPGAFRIVVVDNGSEDGSVEALRSWASGAAPYVAPEGPLARLSTPPVAKPVELVERGPGARVPPGEQAPRLTLIETGANLGFAGGNNVGTRYLLSDPQVDRFWYLNNDCVVMPGAIEAILGTFESDPRMGMLGTTVRYYDAPDRVQAHNGARFSLLTGNGYFIQKDSRAADPCDAKRVVDQTGFVFGASLAVTRELIETVGFMSERYFLYYEEIDWATRARPRFRIGFARGATVFHHGGVSSGTKAERSGRSAFADHHMLRSRLLFYRTHHPWLLPVIWPLGVLQTASRLLRRQPAKANAMARALLGRPYVPA